MSTHSNHLNSPSLRPLIPGIRHSGDLVQLRDGRRGRIRGHDGRGGYCVTLIQDDSRENDHEWPSRWISVKDAEIEAGACESAPAATEGARA
jgi:hypothetical protein